MSQPRDDRQDDLFRPPPAEIINLRHPLVRLAEEIDWDFLAGRFRSVCRVGPGHPPLPTRLVAGLFILKHMHNLRTRRCATGGSRTRISSISVAKWYSGTSCRSIARR
jgi:IS5 family transposase